MPQRNPLQSRRCVAAMLVALCVLASSAVQASAAAPLTQGFEDGEAAGWTRTGMWHVQAEPQTVRVVPEIRDRLVTLPDDGWLPAAPQGNHVAWFGEEVTGTYCGSDFADGTVKQTPQNGCTSTETAPTAGALTSPPFSLAGQSSAYVVFRGWWEIEAVNADIADLMQVQYSVDGGSNWVPAGMLNPLDPSWGGRHQSYTDGGARTSGSWQVYGASLAGAANRADVRIRFVFDTVDKRRNGFRGLLLDGIGVVDGLGQTITDPGAGPFTDAPVEISVGQPELVQNPSGDWSVDFPIEGSHPANHPVRVDWTVTGTSGNPHGTGTATLPPGQTRTEVSVPVSGSDAPYGVTLANPVGGVLNPAGSSAVTPGGSLPVVRLADADAAPGTGADIAVQIAADLAPQSTRTVTVDYSATGVDGVVASTGTLSFPPGSTSQSASVSVPGEHAPYTVTLSNPRNALLDAAARSVATSPLAGITGLAAGGGTLTSGGVPTTLTTAGLDPGSQLVLGVRATGGDQRPQIGETFALTYVSGVVRYKRPKGSYVRLQSGSVLLPMGTVVDATNGHARVTVETVDSGALSEGEFWDGKFGVFQGKRPPAVAELRMAGGDFGTCASGSRKKARRSARKVVRQLWANAKGKFRTKGRFASATVRGTRWLTEDLCLATRVTVEEGVVSVYDSRRKTTTSVGAGDSLTVTALQTARYKKRRGIHGPKLSRR